MATIQYKSPSLNICSILFLCPVVNPAWWNAIPPFTESANFLTNAELSSLCFNDSENCFNRSIFSILSLLIFSFLFLMICLDNSLASFCAPALELTNTNNCPSSFIVSSNAACKLLPLVPLIVLGSGHSSSPFPSILCTFTCKSVNVPECKVTGLHSEYISSASNHLASSSQFPTVADRAMI